MENKGADDSRQVWETSHKKKRAAFGGEQVKEKIKTKKNL